MSGSSSGSGSRQDVSGSSSGSGSRQDVTGDADLKGLCDRVLERVGDRAEAEVSATHLLSGLTRFANSFIHQHVGEDTVSVSLRVAVDRRVASSSTTRVDDAGLDRLVEGVLAAARVRPVDEHWPGVASPTDVPDVAHWDDATADVDPDTRARVVEAFVKEGPELRGAGFCDSEATRTAFANSAGHRAGGRATRATIDAIHQTASSAGTAHRTSHRLGDLDGTAAGARAANLAVRGVDPTDLEPGRYEVVLGPEAIGTIAVFLSFYGFNAKEHLEGQSFAELGEQQFDRAISLWDDALDPRAIGLAFDNEGTPAHRVDLIEAGRTTALCHDRRTAARAGTESTGHAVPGSEIWGPMGSDLFVGPGEASDDDLLAGVERGVFVTQFHYCRILDPKTQVVTGLTRNGTFLIEDGRVTRPLTNLRFTQSFVEALGPGRVLAVGDTARFAETEFGSGLVHAPALRLAGWNFTGGARG